MSTMSISTLELLEQSDMPPTYARAIAKAIEADLLIGWASSPPRRI